MRREKWDWLLIVHALIILWAALFVYSLFFRSDGGNLAAALAPGNIAGLFVSIPLAVISLAALAKKRFSDKCSMPFLVLSLLNVCIGVADWIAFIILLKTPKGP